MLTYEEQTRINVAAPCRTDGIGCDGENSDRRAEYGICACSCHSDYARMFATNDEVHRFHIDRETYRPAAAHETDVPYSIRDSAGVVWVLFTQYRNKG